MRLLKIAVYLVLKRLELSIRMDLLDETPNAVRVKTLLSPRV